MEAHENHIAKRLYNFTIIQKSWIIIMIILLIFPFSCFFIIFHFSWLNTKTFNLNACTRIRWRKFKRENLLLSSNFQSLFWSNVTEMLIYQCIKKKSMKNPFSRSSKFKVNWNCFLFIFISKFNVPVISLIYFNNFLVYRKKKKHYNNLHLNLCLKTYNIFFIFKIYSTKSSIKKCEKF